VVAMGAAIHAASLLDQGGEAFLLDVTPLSLQIGVAGGLTEPVIERNTPVPIEQTRTFTTFNDYQESVSIRVYQGESRESSENEMLGHFEFGGFRKGRRGEVEIDVTFEINTDGIVNVTARDRATGEAASTRITLSSGLSESEISSIMDRGVADRVATAKVPDPGESLDELIPVPQPTTTQRPAPAREKPQTRPAAPTSQAQAPRPVPAPPARPAPAPAPQPARAAKPAPQPLAEDDVEIITAVELGDAGIASPGEGKELTDELDLDDIEGLERDGQSEPLFDEPGTDLADDEVS